MKALIFENPDDHGCSLADCFSKLFRENGIESEIFRSGSEAYLSLITGEFDLVLIHHAYFDIVDFFRLRNPNIKYIGYSTELVRDDSIKKGTLADAFRKEMSKHYDRVISDNEIEEFIKSFKKG